MNAIKSNLEQLFGEEMAAKINNEVNGAANYSYILARYTKEISAMTPLNCPERITAECLIVMNQCINQLQGRLIEHAQLGISGR
jgi:hypothetical protein